MYFCSRRRKRQYRHFLNLRRAARSNKIDESDITKKEGTGIPQSEDIPDTVMPLPQPIISMPQHTVAHHKCQTEDCEVFLHARKVARRGDEQCSLKIVSIFHIAPLFETSSLTRYFSMTKKVTEKSQVKQYQYGLFKPGNFIPINVRTSRQYRVVKMDGEGNKVLVSNDVKDNKLYLRINKRRRRVTVTADNEQSYFDLERLESGSFVFHIAAIPGYALKYTPDRIIVAEYKKGNFEFEFELQSTSPNHLSKKFKFCTQTIPI